MVKVSSWGRLDQCEHVVIPLSDRTEVGGKITRHTGLPFGMGRSYGDVCLNPGGVLWNIAGLDRFIEFNHQSGLLRCEAGVLLRDIQQMALAHGWLLPVTPGTQLVTIGGAIANDVHGKNHHVHGSFGDHVQHLQLVRTDGSVIDCGPELLPEWFAATVGGLGLTGVITQAQIQLVKVDGPWLEAETIPYTNLEEFFSLADQSEMEWEHTVSWIDCLSGKGRGIFLRANYTNSVESPQTAKKLSMPFVPPLSLVNKLSLHAFNAAYFHLKKLQSERSLVHYESFFYPLDNLLHWNRMYGPKGFYQYQCVLPREQGNGAIQTMLKMIAQSGEGSFLAVLKTFGNRQPRGLLSFPKPGVTLALDFPNKGTRTLTLFNQLDSVVRDAGGRIYAAKDARMPKDLFEAGYPKLSEFVNFRDPGISSALSRRLLGS